MEDELRVSCLAAGARQRSEVSLGFAHGCAVRQSRAEPHLVRSECHYRVSSEAWLFTDLLPASVQPCRGDRELWLRRVGVIWRWLPRWGRGGEKLRGSC